MGTITRTDVSADGKAKSGEQKYSPAVMALSAKQQHLCRCILWMWPRAFMHFYGREQPVSEKEEAKVIEHIEMVKRAVRDAPDLLKSIIHCVGCKWPDIKGHNPRWHAAQVPIRGVVWFVSQITKIRRQLGEHPEWVELEYAAFCAPSDKEGSKTTSQVVDKPRGTKAETQTPASPVAETLMPRNSVEEQGNKASAGVDTPGVKRSDEKVAVDCLAQTQQSHHSNPKPEKAPAQPEQPSTAGEQSGDHTEGTTGSKKVLDALRREQFGARVHDPNAFRHWIPSGASNLVSSIQLEPSPSQQASPAPTTRTSCGSRRPPKPQTKGAVQKVPSLNERLAAARLREEHHQPEAESTPLSTR